jgi:hypothetical protein
MFNIDFGSSYGQPSDLYGAAGNQAGRWNAAPIGTSALRDLSGALTSTTVTLDATFNGGNNSETPVSDDELLLHDHFDTFDVSGSSSTTWTVTLDNLSPGFVDVYLYAPSNSAVSTGNTVVNGVVVEEIEGQQPGTLVEGVTFILTRARIIDGENRLTINGSDGSSMLSGLSALQLLAITEPPSPRMFLYNGFTTDNLLTLETHGGGHFYDMATDGGEIWIGVNRSRFIVRSTQGGAPGTFETIQVLVPPGQSAFFQINSIVYANDRFVCITDPAGYLDQSFSKTFYSTDGLVWTEGGLNGLDGSNVYSTIEYDRSTNMLVAPGLTSTNKLTYSQDMGLTWTAIASPFTVACTSVANGAAGSGNWVATGKGTYTLAHSSDGMTWTGVSAANSPFTTHAASVAYYSGVGGSDGRFVAIGEGSNHIAYSDDAGMTWTAVEPKYDELWWDTPPGFSVDATNGIVMWNGTSFWITGGDSLSGEALYSYDGAHWASSQVNIRSRCIASDLRPYQAPPRPTPKLVVGVTGFYGNNSSATLAFSDDGLEWTLCHNMENLFRPLRDIAYNGTDAWVCTGTPLPITTGVPPRTYPMRVSSDLARWSAAPSSFVAFEEGIRVVYAAGYFYACGRGGTGTKMARSVDGFEWTPIGSTALFETVCNQITYDGVGLFVAVGDGPNNIATSTDGVTFSVAPGNVFEHPFPASPLSQMAYTVVYGNGVWVAGANNGGVNNLAYSTDGSTWIGLGDQIVLHGVKLLAYGAGRWFISNPTLAGHPTATSTDGINWTTVQGVLPEDMMYSESLDRWFATEVFGLLYSDDGGTTWIDTNFRGTTGITTDGSTGGGQLFLGYTFG